MKQSSTLALITALALALAAVPAAAADLDGTWDLTILGKSPLGEDQAQITFVRDGFNLTATIEMNGVTTDCVGYIDGQELRFYYIKPGKKEDIVSKFTGHVRGDLMGGEIETEKGNATWKATRGQEPGVDLSGTWTLQMKGESPSGLDRVKMSFRQEGHNLVATLHGDSREIECEGFVDGRIITFYYVRATDGERFVAKFTGQLAGALMGGEVDLGSFGKTTWRATQDLGSAKQTGS